MKLKYMSVMKFAELSQCSKRLTFLTQKLWPKALPQLAWRGLLLTASIENEVQAVELDEKHPFENVIFDIYPRLNLLEVHEIATNAKALSVEFNISKLFETYRIRYDDRLIKLLNQIQWVDQQFIRWAIDKQLGENDLAPLSSLNDQQIKLLNKYFSHMAKLNPSKNEGVQILEWLIDVFLQTSTENFIESVLDINTSSELSLRLKYMRYPESTERETKSTLFIKSLSWSKNTHVRAVRQGDQAGIELKIFLQNKTDLKSQIQTLQQVANRLDADSIERF
jgi:hypothetical protein